MTNVIDLSGHKIGKWSVLSLDLTRDKNGSRKYRCICDCGTIRIVRSNHLLNSDSTGCGCTKIRKYDTPEEALWHRLYFEHRAKAKHRKIKWLLSFDDFFELSNQICFFSGTNSVCLGLKSNTYNRNNTNTRTFLKGFTITHTGIDRIDNRSHYSRMNTIPCCKPCNTIKNGITPKMVELLYYELHGRNLME